MTERADGPPITPDGRYIVVRWRLWRTTNPDLNSGLRQRLVSELMAGRWAVKAAVRLSRARVQNARALGERGPRWWHDGTPDLKRHMARNTSYAKWWEDRCRR